jgi:predicted ester cyclase
MLHAISHIRSTLSVFQHSIFGAGMCISAATVLLAGMSYGGQKSKMDQEQENKELVLQMYHEFDQGALDVFGTSVSSDFKAEVMGNQTLDWAGFKQFGAQFLSAFPDGRHIFDRVIVQGDQVVTIGNYVGTHMGALMGIPPTGKRISLTVMHLDRVEDGTIIEHFGIANGMDLMKQLGMSDDK